MHAGGQDAPQRPRSRRAAGWLVAGLIAAGLLVALWLREQSGADSAVPAAPVATTTVLLPPALIADAERGTGSEESSAAPIPLTSGRASLTVLISETGVFASPAWVRLRREDGGDALELTTFIPPDGELTWTDLPAGAYAIEARDDAWLIEEPRVTLEAGDRRTVAMSPRRMLAVRVVGGLTGKGVAVRSVSVSAMLELDARIAADLVEAPLSPPTAGFALDARFPTELVDTQVSAPGGSFALLAPPEHTPQGVPVQSLTIRVETEYGAAASSPITLASIAASPRLTLRAPEPAIVGRVTSAEPRDAASPQASWQTPVVQLLPEGESARLVNGTETWRRGARSRIDVAKALDVVDAQPDGRYELRLAQRPLGPVHVVAVSRHALPCDSGPLTLPADGTPLHLDLVLPAAGRIEGTVRVGDAQRASGGAAPSLSIQSVSARSLDDAEEQRPLERRGTALEDEDGLDDPHLPAFEVAGLPGGDYELAVNLQPTDVFTQPVAARRLTQRVTVRTGEVTTVELAADAPATRPTISGTLILPTAFEATWTNITLSALGEGLRQPNAATRPDATGRYEFRDVPAGSYALRVQAWGEGQGQAVGYAEVAIAEQDVLVPPLDVGRPEVRFHVHDAGERLWIYPEGGGQNFVVFTDAGGVGSLFGLQPGRYRVRPGDEDETGFEVTEGAALITVEVP